VSILALLTQGDSHKLCFLVKYANFNFMLSLSTYQNHYSFIFSILNHKWIFFSQHGTRWWFECYIYYRPNNLSHVCLYLSLYISFLLFGHWDRKHYYIKVVESIQFVWTGNSGISRDLCNANTYRSIHEGYTLYAFYCFYIVVLFVSVLQKK
jgi:hypothetical protein